MTGFYMKYNIGLKWDKDFIKSSETLKKQCVKNILEAVHRCSTEKQFWKTLQNSQEQTCNGDLLHKKGLLGKLLSLHKK